MRRSPKLYKREAEAFGHFEAEVQVQFLPRCPVCEGKHPRAYKPLPEILSHCPTCGSEVPPPGEEIDVPAKVTAGLWFGNLLMRIGAWLNRLSERM